MNLNTAISVIFSPLIYVSIKFNGFFFFLLIDRLQKDSYLLEGTSLLLENDCSNQSNKEISN